MAMNQKMRMSERMVLACGCAAAMMLSGCSLFSSSTSTTSRPMAFAPPARPAPMPAPVTTPPNPEPQAGPAWSNEPETVSGPSHAVNLFGEIGGVERRVQLASAENGLQQHTACDEGYDSDITVDPSGKWMAFSSTRNSDHADIYLQRVDGSSVVQLTSDPAEDVQPAFSPDGKRVAFASTRAGNWDIYVMDVDGKNVQQVTSSPAEEMHPSFSPDGNRLVYCALSGKSDQWELWIADLNTHERKMIGQGLFPSWCPKAGIDRIAFQRARQRGSHWFGLWTVDLIDGEPRRLTEVASSSQAAVVSPSWSPDGLRLTFAAILAPNAPGGEHAPRHTDVWVVNADGTGKQRLTDSQGLNVSPFWASSNRIFFVSDRGGHENVWSVRAEGAPTLAGNPGKPAGKPAAVGSADTGEIGH